MSRRIPSLTGGLSRHIVTRALAATGLFGLVVGVVLAGLIAHTAVAATGINKQINFQGKVVNSNGTNVTDGSYSFTFKLYSASSGGVAIWTETKSLTVTDGVFQTALGDTTSLPGSVDFNTDNIYLGINFNSDGEMSPRIRFTAAPYAFNSDLLDGLDSSAFAQLNPSSAQSGSLNVTASVQAGTSLQAPLVDTASAVALNIGTGMASSVTVGRTSTTLTLQGSSSSVFTATSGANKTTVGFVAPTANRSINFPDAGGTICTDVASTCSATYQAAGSYLAKNAADTSAASIAAGNFLYSFSNSNGTPTTGGVLKLDNNGNTAATLLVTASGNPGAGAALIKANNTNGTPSGNLIDLQTNGASEFSVNTSGNVTANGTVTAGTYNGQTITSAASFTGTVTTASTLTITAGNFDQSSSSGTFKTGTGPVSLNGDATVAANKNLSLASGTGTFSQAYTGTSDATSITANSLTTGSGLKVTTSNNTAANTSWSAVSLNVTNAQATTAVSGANLIAGLDLQFTQNPTVSGSNTTVANFAIKKIDTSVTDNTVNSIINVANNDTATGNQITATNGVLVNGAGVTNGINLSGTFGTNLITSSNFTVAAAGNVTIAPTAASVVGLTVKGTTSTAANVLEIFNSAASPTRQDFFDQNGSLNVAQVIQPTSNNAVDLGLSSAAFRTGYFGTSVISPLYASADVASGTSAGVTLRSGNGTAGGAGSGNVTVDVGSKNGGGSAGNINIGDTNALNVNVGRNSTNTLALTLMGNAATSSMIFSNAANTFTTTVSPVVPIANTTLNFPASATTGAYTICTSDIASCSGAYIQNQSAANQTGDFRISGNGRANGSFLTPLLDTPSGTTTLNVGTNNATVGISLNQNTTILSGKSLTVAGGALTQSGGAFSLTGNAASQVSTSSGALTITSAAAATWSTGAGDLTVTAAGNLNLGNGGGNVINVGTNAAAHTIAVGTDTANAQGLTLGSTNAGSTVTSRAGAAAVSLSNSGWNLKTSTNSTTAATIQNASGANITRVDTTDTNLVQNPGAEVAFGTEWAAYGSNTTVARNTANAWSGLGSVSVVVTPATATVGAQNNLGAALAISQTYTLSFYAKLKSGDPAFADISARYSRDGTSGTEVACANYNTQTIVSTGWTRVTCTIATSGTAGTASAYIAIYQAASAARTFYLDGVQLEQTNNIANVYGAGALQMDAVVTAPLGLQNTEDSTTALVVQNAGGTAQFAVDTLNSKVIVGGTLQANTITPTGTLAIGASNQTLSLLGSSASSLAVTNGGNTLTVNFATPTVNGAVYQFANPTTAATTYTICTTDQNSCGATASAGYLRKGVVETDSVNVSAGNLALTITNNGSGTTGVLKLDNAGAQNSALVVTSQANVSSGQATIFASNTLNNATGNLLDLQSTQSAAAASRFAVDIAGNVTQASGTTTTDTINGQRISGAANFTGTVTTAGQLTVSANGAAITGNSTVSGTLGVTSAISATGTGAAELIVSGAPAAAGNTSLVQVGNAIASGSTSGTYLGLNLPSGATADMLNYQLNGISKFKLDTSANITAVGTYNTNTFTSSGLQFGAASGATVQAAASQALTLTGHATSTWSTDTGNLTIGPTAASSQVTLDSGSSGTVNVGNSNATTIAIGRTASTTTLNGTSQIGASAGTGSYINNGSTVNTVLALGNFATGGSIGANSATVDIYTYISIAQTTAGQTLTIPTPTANTTYGRVLYLTNIGTASFTLLTTTIGPGSTATLVWANTNGAAAWTFAGADGSGILNQNTADQTANFRISGTGRANTSFITPLVDSISGALGIGTGTASAITLGGAPTTGTISLLTNGSSAGVTVKDSVNSATSLVVQNSNAESVLLVDTTTTNLLKNSGFEPNTTANWAAKGTTSTFAADTSSGNFYHGTTALKAVVTAATSGVTTTGNASGAFTSAIAATTQYQMTFFAKCSGSIGTLTIGRQDVAGTDVNVVTTGACTTGWQQFTAHWTTGGTITNPQIYVTLGSATSGTLWIDAVSLIQTNTSAATNYQIGAVQVGGVFTNPAIFQNVANSTLAFQIQNAAGTTNLLTADTINNVVKVGTTSSADLANTALLASYGQIVNTLRIGTSGNSFDFNPSTGPSYSGTARPTKRVTLVPEYPGATMTADGTGNSGTMTSDFCSATNRRSINASLCPTAGDEHNYYKWVSASGTNNYDIYVRYQIPSDFSAFPSGGVINMFGFRTGTSDAVTLSMFQANGTQCGSSTNEAGTNGAWTETAMGGTITSCTVAAQDVVVFRIHVVSTGSANPVLAGELRFDYLAQF